jgi:hypothetical protein
MRAIAEAINAEELRPQDDLQGRSREDALRCQEFRLFADSYWL